MAGPTIQIDACNPCTRTGKSHYSETEAAEELGISIEQLRTMIRSHVVDRDED